MAFKCFRSATFNKISSWRTSAINFLFRCSKHDKWKPSLIDGVVRKASGFSFAPRFDYDQMFDFRLTCLNRSPILLDAGVVCSIQCWPEQHVVCCVNKDIVHVQSIVVRCADVLLLDVHQLFRFLLSLFMEAGQNAANRGNFVRTKFDVRMKVGDVPPSSAHVATIAARNTLSNVKPRTTRRHKRMSGKRHKRTKGGHIKTVSLRAIYVVVHD